MAKRRNKSEERDLAERRITTLLARAEAESAAGRPELADRYGGLVKELVQRYQTGFPADAKAALCRKCGAYGTAANRRVRFTGGRMSVTCLQCGAVRRRGLLATDRAAPKA